MAIRSSSRKTWSTIGLLFKWQGGVYQMIWQEVLVFIIIYVFLSLTYRLLLPADGREFFEQICTYSKKFTSNMPVAFILGFFVSTILRRWWSYFLLLPFPDTIALDLTAYVHGKEVKPLCVRSTVIRYVNLSLVLCLRCISTAVKKRYPTEHSLVVAELMTMDEYIIYMNSGGEKYHKYYIPLIWAVDIVSKARVELGLIRQDPEANQTVIDIGIFRDTLNKLIIYDWVPPPLIYAQVTTISVYLYYLACLLSYQFLDNSSVNSSKKEVDLYFPIVAVLNFSIYVGWMKVAESLLNPLGEDEVDFDVNGLIQRNLEISDILVNQVHSVHPTMVKDQYWDDQNPQLPYTMDTIPDKPIGTAFAGSVTNLELKQQSVVEVTDSAPPSRHNSLKEYIERRRSRSHYSESVTPSTTKVPERKYTSFRELPKHSEGKQASRPFVIGSFHESIKMKKRPHGSKYSFSTASTSDLEKTSNNETKISSVSEDSL